LLPKATRTHTGYRVFDPQATHYVDFIQKAKTVGLTLKEAKQLLELARRGKNPCPQGVSWIDEKLWQWNGRFALSGRCNNALMSFAVPAQRLPP
jgi:DNA-binding transcriptional MerR regulator